MTEGWKPSRVFYVSPDECIEVLPRDYTEEELEELVRQGMAVKFNEECYSEAEKHEESKQE